MSIKFYFLSSMASKDKASLNEVQRELQSAMSSGRISLAKFTSLLKNPSMLENMDPGYALNISNILEAFSTADLPNSNEMNLIFGEKFSVKGESFDIDAVIDIDDDEWYEEKGDKNRDNG